MEDLSEPPEKEVCIKVNSIDVQDKTMKVINKLRRMSSIIEQINRLKSAKQKLNDFKSMILQLRAEAIHSNCKCTKLSSAIQICRHKKRKLKPGESKERGELFVQESSEAGEDNETCFKPLDSQEMVQLQPILADIDYRID